MLYQIPTILISNYGLKHHKLQPLGGTDIEDILLR
jgi:hypothetical protein